MKKILTTILLSFTFALEAQQIDDEYLDSLPKDIAEDLKSTIDAKKELEKPIYRRASTQIDKIDNIDEENEIFGSKFFDTIQSSFMPVNEPNLDASYILDFGDVLEIQLVGQKNYIDSFELKRDGSINIPDIGRVLVAGLSLNDASSLIKQKVSSAYIGTNAYVTLANIRDINILIAGNAFNPGIYTLNGNANILHAVSMAGGINKLGSFRKITLKREGKVIDTLDIYNVLNNGVINNSGLRSGDSIVIHPYQKIVSIESGVNRVGRYEIKDNETLMDLINLANGLNSKVISENITLKRVVNNKVVTETIDYKNANEFKLLDGDSVYISERKLISVKINGAVINPGTYVLPQGSTLSQIIVNAGGYESNAYPFAGYLNNKKTNIINIKAKERLYQAFLNNLILNGSNSMSSENSNLPLMLKRLEDAEVTGRIIAEFDLDILKSNPKLDTVLEDGDEIIIPALTQQVYVQGEVSNAGSTRYAPGKDIDYYLDISGGVLDSASIDSIFVIHPNGETDTIVRNRNLSFLQNNNKQLIYPGSIIYVPQSADLTNSLQRASIWAPIISSIVLSITSLSVLNNN